MISWKNGRMGKRVHINLLTEFLTKIGLFEK